MSRKDRSNGYENINYSSYQGNNAPYRRSVDIEGGSEKNTSEEYANTDFPAEEVKSQFNSDGTSAQARSNIFREHCNNMQSEADAEKIKNDAGFYTQNTKEEAEKEADNIVTDAKAEASKIIAEATSEANSIINAASIEIDAKKNELSKREFSLNLRENALERNERELQAEKDELTNKRNEVINQANAKRDNIILLAYNRQAELIAEGESKSSSLIAQAMAEKERIENSVTEEALREAKEHGLREYLTEHGKTQEAKREELNDIYCAISENSASLTKQVANEAFTLSYKMNKSLNDGISSINDCLQQVLAVQNNVSTALDKWQRGLYTTQLTPLCTAYETISRLITTHEGNLAKYQSAVSDPANAAKVELLAPILKTLKTFREQLGRALAPFGISVFYPEPDEGFDPNFHSVEDVYTMPDMLIDQPITECIRPGFIKAGFDNSPQAVLVRAVVRVKTESPEI